MATRSAIGLDELESQSAQLLPARETLCLFACVNVSPVVGVNLAIAINAASINTQANALAMQYLASVHP